MNVFSRDEATLYKLVSFGPSDGWMDGRSVGNQLFFRPTRSDLCRVYGLVKNKAQQAHHAKQVTNHQIDEPSDGTDTSSHGHAWR